MKKDFSKAFRAVWLLLVIVISLGAMAQTPQEWKSLKRTVNFFVANDLGRNGYYDQRTIADLMTDGCNMGVKSLNRYLNQYEGADEVTKDITKRLINLEEKLTVDIRKYL